MLGPVAAIICAKDEAIGIANDSSSAGAAVLSRDLAWAERCLAAEEVDAGMVFIT